MPMYYNEIFFGFIFFNSIKKDSFVPEVLHHLDMFGHMISLLTINEITSIRTLVAAINTENDLAHHRDHETGSHLDRMSRFSRIIAKELAEKYTLNDNYIEHIFMFSPLHDIGKIGIPDHILLKPGKLSVEEFDVMKTHSNVGRKMIDEMLENFGLNALQHIDILRNIAEFHHETVNGKGYPEGLQGADIPLESRIVAVADVFDALTSHRPYKDAWTNDEAFTTLRKLTGHQLDEDCVNALLKNREKIEEIQKQFQEDRFG